MRSYLMLVVVSLGACAKQAPPAKPAPAPAPAVAEPARKPVPPPAAPAPVEPPPLPQAPAWVEPASPRPHVTAALAQLPAGATVVLGLDVPRLASTPLGEMLRESLMGKGATVPKSCASLNLTALGNLVVGGGGGPQNFVIIADGKAPERAFVACGKDAIAAKGGALKKKKVAGRNAHYVTGSPEDNGWIAWTKAGTPVMAGSEAQLAATLNPKAPKLEPAVAGLAKRADHARMIWAVAQVSPDELRAIGVPAGLVSGTVTIRAGVDLGAEIELDVVVGFATTDDATRMAGELRTFLGQARQTPPTDALLKDVKLGVHGTDLRVIIHLDAAATSKAFALIKMG